MRKLVFAYVKPKQLQSTLTADQHLCFRYLLVDSTIHLFPIPEISSLLPSSLVVKPGLCRTRSGTLKTGFLMTWLILYG